MDNWHSNIQSWHHQDDCHYLHRENHRDLSLGTFSIANFTFRWIVLPSCSASPPVCSLLCLSDNALVQVPVFYARNGRFPPPAFFLSVIECLWSWNRSSRSCSAESCVRLGESNSTHNWLRSESFEKSPTSGFSGRAIDLSMRYEQGIDENCGWKR